MDLGLSSPWTSPLLPLLPRLKSSLLSHQVVPPRVTEPHQRPVPWDVRAVSVEAAVTPAEPHARVLFHLKGQDWPPGPSSLPCARLHATHPAGTVHRACRFQVSQKLHSLWGILESYWGGSCSWEFWELPDSVPALLAFTGPLMVVCYPFNQGFVVLNLSEAQSSQL